MVENVEKLKRQLHNLEKESKELQEQKDRLKWLLILAGTTWPLGLLVNPWVCPLIATVWLTFWVVGLYISYFHRKDCARKIEDLTRRLRGLLN